MAKPFSRPTAVVTCGFTLRSVRGLARSRRREPETKSADLFASSSPDDESCTRTALPVPRYGDQGRGRLLTNTFSHRRHHRPRRFVTDLAFRS